MNAAVNKGDFGPVARDGLLLEAEVLAMRLEMHLRLRPWVKTIDDLSNESDCSEIFEDLLPGLRALHAQWRKDRQS